MASEDRINQVLDEIRGMGGEPYAAYQCTGYRKPVRLDAENLLTAIVMASRPRAIWELGTGYGVSTLCMARGNPSAFINTVEFDPDIAEIAGGHFEKAGIRHRIGQVISPTVDVASLVRVLFYKPDLVLFDHAMSEYLPDIIDLDKARGTHPFLLLADNVLDHAEEVAEFMDWVIKHAFTWMIYPTECGLLIAQL